MKENYIIVENVSAQDIESILTDFANEYPDANPVKGIQLYAKQNDARSFLVGFTNRPDFDIFSFCINYLRYPRGFENFDPYVRGYFRTENLHTGGGFNMGEWVVVYLSENDTEYDNVSVVNENNHTYLYSFTGKTKKMDLSEERFERVERNINDYRHVTDIFPSKNSGKPWWKFW